MREAVAAGRQDIAQLNDEMGRFAQQDHEYNSARDNTWLTRYKVMEMCLEKLEEEMKVMREERVVLAGLGVPDDPFVLSDELSDDSYPPPLVENRTPVPVRVPAYPGGNITRKGRHSQRARRGGKVKMVALGRNVSSEEVSLERAGVGHARRSDLMTEFIEMATRREQESEEEKAALLDTHGEGSSSGALILRHARQGSVETGVQWEARLRREASERYDWFVREGREEWEHEDQMWYMRASTVTEDVSTGRILPIVDETE